MILAKVCENQEAASILVQIFIKHVRVESSEKLPASILMAFYHMLRLQPKILKASKEREVVNKLFGILPVFFDL